MTWTHREFEVDHDIGQSTRFYILYEVTTKKVVCSMIFQIVLNYDPANNILLLCCFELRCIITTPR